MNDVKEYFERIRDMVRIIKLEQDRLQALKEGCYSVGGSSFDRVSTSGKADFTDRMDAFLDKEMMYEYVKDENLKECFKQVKDTQVKLMELKTVLKGNELKGLYVVEMMYIYNQTMTTTARIYECNRRQAYAYRKAFMEYCAYHKLFQD